MIELDGEPAGPGALASLALTNYGHFTTLLVENGRVRGLELHLERLIRDCRTLFDAALDPDRVRKLARRAAPEHGRATVRVTVFDPALNLGNIAADARPGILVTSRPAPDKPPGPLRVRSVVHRRDLPEVKSVGLFPTLRLRRQAQRAGYDDVLFTGADGDLLEGGTWNIGLVPGGEVLAGTTRQLLRRATDGPTELVGLADLDSVEAVFATNAAVGVRPVTGIDDRAFPAAHPSVTRLAEIYQALPGSPL
ncbi:aminotransferase class IV [Streptomyces sp. T7(2022)]|uniref:aminotransferase class IV n=1 Tax=Streptomyces sp. T7(2022) TaxID=2916034 RepID=UPI001EE42FB0|nr:aminotransferase class IV [Streptomyces sp. T7(2022)]MCG5119510.1 aminotransferase class IV [Streptomyces sp. T7(2022)]